MLAYMRKIQDARRRDDGASAVEYGLIIAAIAAIIVAAVFAFGNLVKEVFNDTETKICNDPGVDVAECKDAVQ